VEAISLQIQEVQEKVEKGKKQTQEEELHQEQKSKALQESNKTYK
jgi:hypothetical protein